MKTTIKDIRNGIGIDITNYSFEECQKLQQTETEAGGYMQLIAWAPCKYGAGAMLYYGRGTHRFYKITRRTTAIFCF